MTYLSFLSLHSFAYVFTTEQSYILNLLLLHLKELHTIWFWLREKGMNSCGMYKVSPAVQRTCLSFILLTANTPYREPFPGSFQEQRTLGDRFLNKLFIQKNTDIDFLLTHLWHFFFFHELCNHLCTYPIFLLQCLHLHNILIWWF